jgi:hypothetical protein
MGSAGRYVRYRQFILCIVSPNRISDQEVLYHQSSPFVIIVATTSSLSSTTSVQTSYAPIHYPLVGNKDLIILQRLYSAI